MQIPGFLQPSTKNIVVWSLVVFAAVFFLSWEDDGSDQAALTASNPVTGLAVAPLASTDCGDSVCSYPENQLDCPIDCRTSAGISYLVAEGDEADVWVEFWDSRYQAGQKVQIDLVISPENVVWNPYNGCFFGGVEMGSEPRSSVVGWPASTISEDGHFRVETTCRLPDGVEKGPHKLLATATMVS